MIQDDGDPWTSAIVLLNGKVIVRPRQLVGRATAELRLPVSLQEANRLRIVPLGRRGARVRVWILGGAQIIGSGGGTVTSVGSHAKVLVQPGAVEGSIAIHIVDVPQGTATYTPIATRERIYLDLSKVRTIGTGDISIVLPVWSPPSQGSVTLIGAHLGNNDGVPVWKEATVDQASATATVVGPLKAFVTEVQIAGGSTTLEVFAESYLAPSGDEAGPVSPAEASAATPRLGFASLAGTPCYLKAPSNWFEIYGMDTGHVSAVSVWRDPGSRALGGAHSAIVLIPGWQREITNCDNYRNAAKRADAYLEDLLALLRSNGLDAYPILVVDYPTFNSFRFSGQELAGALSYIQTTYGVRPVLVGHSMGGLLAREAAEQLNEKPLGIITLATPHLGTKLAEVSGTIIPFFWNVAPETDGKRSLVYGLADRDRPEAPLRVYGSKVNFQGNCAAQGGQCTFTNDGSASTFDRLKFEITGGILCWRGDCVNDGVVADYSAIPSFFAASGRVYFGYDHTRMIGGGGAAIDADLVSDLKSFLGPTAPPGGGLPDLIPISVIGPELGSPDNPFPSP